MPGDSIHPYKNEERNLHTTIDYLSKLVGRRREDPKSIISYFQTILEKKYGVSGISLEEYLQEEMRTMDIVLQENTASYTPNLVTHHKQLLKTKFEKTINLEDAQLAQELLEGVFGDAFASVISKDTIYETLEEDVTTDFVSAHLFDRINRQVREVMVLNNTLVDDGKQPLGLIFQWGNEKTDEVYIKNRIEFVVRGITEFASMTELYYTKLDDKTPMPVQVPAVLIGGDLQHVSKLVDGNFTKGGRHEASHNPVIFNALEQMCLQIKLYAGIVEKILDQGASIHQKLLTNPAAKDHLEQMLHTYHIVLVMLERIYDANKPSLERSQDHDDVVHKKILSACSDIAEIYGVDIT